MFSALLILGWFAIAGTPVALLAEVPSVPPPVAVEPIRALYLTSGVAASKRFDDFLAFLGTTAVNALVIDLKDGNGRLAFRPDDAALQRYAPARPTIRDLKERVTRIHERGGYAIARFPVFQDTAFAEAHPSEAIRSSNGNIWRDGIRAAWLDPASKRTWEYAVALALEARAQGFDEVNLDYIRFPSDGPGFRSVRYPRWDGKVLKRTIIQSFAKAVDERVRRRGIRVSADLFGLVFWAKGDLGIGQHLESLAPYFDVLAPMVYPSHYRSGFLGKQNPAKFPYDVIRATLDRGRQRLEILPPGARATVRPWIQDFNLGATYTTAMVRAEQRAAADAGALGWMAWNPRGNYHTEAFR